MTDLPRLRPHDVVADHLDDPFWEGCRHEQFLVQRCGICGRHYWPAGSCVDDGVTDMSWVRATGRGVVHTYTVFHRAFDPRFSDQVPYVLAVVELDEGPFFHTDLLECRPDDVFVGLGVEVVYEHLDGTTTIPHFRPRR